MAGAAAPAVGGDGHCGGRPSGGQCRTAGTERALVDRRGRWLGGRQAMDPAARLARYFAWRGGAKPTVGRLGDHGSAGRWRAGGGCQADGCRQGEGGRPGDRAASLADRSRPQAIKALEALATRAGHAGRVVGRRSRRSLSRRFRRHARELRSSRGGDAGCLWHRQAAPSAARRGDGFAPVFAGR